MKSQTVTLIPPPPMKHGNSIIRTKDSPIPSTDSADAIRDYSEFSQISPPGPDGSAYEGNPFISPLSLLDASDFKDTLAAPPPTEAATPVSTPITLGSPTLGYPSLSQPRKPRIPQYHAYTPLVTSIGTPNMSLMDDPLINSAMDRGYSGGSGIVFGIGHRGYIINAPGNLGSNMDVPSDNMGSSMGPRNVNGCGDNATGGDVRPQTTTRGQRSKSLQNVFVQDEENNNNNGIAENNTGFNMFTPPPPPSSLQQYQQQQQQQQQYKMATLNIPQLYPQQQQQQMAQQSQQRTPRLMVPPLGLSGINGQNQVSPRSIQSGERLRVSPRLGSGFGEHPQGEFPSRTLFVRNINSNIEDEELYSIFSPYGEIKSIYSQTKFRGFIMVSYFDIRNAENAMKCLQGKLIHRKNVDIHYSIPKENPSEKDANQGFISIFNYGINLSNDMIQVLFGANDEIKSIFDTPNKLYKIVEFYDLRAAEHAMHKFSGFEITDGHHLKLEYFKNPQQYTPISKPLSMPATPLLDSLVPPTLQQQQQALQKGAYKHGINITFTAADFTDPLTKLPSPRIHLLQDHMTTLSGNNVNNSNNNNNIGNANGNGTGMQRRGGLQIQRPQNHSSPVTTLLQIPSDSAGIGSGGDVDRRSLDQAKSSLSSSLSPSSSTTSSSSTTTSSSSNLGKGKSKLKRIPDNSSQDLFSIKIVDGSVGGDLRTTLMIKNIPNKYTQKMLLESLDAVIPGGYNFFYLPIDFQNRCNVGYAFINMTDTCFIPPLYMKQHNKKWDRFNSEKICEIAYARIQSLPKLIDHFKNSSLLNEDEKVRPVVLVNDKLIPFPLGTSLLVKKDPVSGRSIVLM